MQNWIDNENWIEIENEESAHKKMDILQNLLVQKYQEFFHEKTRTISSDDQPYFTHKLNILKRRKGREFHKRRKSKKWKVMDEEYQKELSKA